MSSALFYVKVLAIQERVVDLDCVTSGASAVDDLCTSPAFVLMLLVDAARASPLRTVLGDDRLRLVEPTWMKLNASAYVESTQLLSRRNALGDDALYKIMDEIESAGLSPPDEIHELRRRGHGYVLRATATDRRYLAHLTVGMEFDTTAYDVIADALAG
jgi:hypothetical protein